MERASFHRLAHCEVSEAAEFYQLESLGLGVAFLDEVECCTQTIRQYPEADQLIIGSIGWRFL